MIIVLIESLVKSLIMTLLVESCGAFLLGVRKWKDMLLVVLVNVMTNLPLVLVLDIVYIYHRGYLSWLLIACLESIAVWAEGTLYSRYMEFRGIGPFWLSLLLNVISYFGGSLLS